MPTQLVAYFAISTERIIGFISKQFFTIIYRIDVETNANYQAVWLAWP